MKQLRGIKERIKTLFTTAKATENTHLRHSKLKFSVDDATVGTTKPNRRRSRVRWLAVRIKITELGELELSLKDTQPDCP